ncbi:MAG TPA: outer membrane protein [Pseudolabrys sp.]
MAIASALLMMESAAFAADMPAKAPAAVSSYDWNGFYLGVNAGYAVANNPGKATTVFIPSGVTDDNIDADTGAKGWLAGVQAGYNWQSGPLLLGVEADIQATGQKGTACLGCTPAIGSTNSVESKLPWFGTVRGRLGLTNGPVLFYTTGGLAYGQLETTAMTSAGTPNSLVDVSSTKTGWAAGGGIEAALSGNWTAKIEYLYFEFGSVSGLTPRFVAGGGGPVFGSYLSTFTDHLVRAGLNYRFGDRSTAGSGFWETTPRHNWSGVYAGVNAGYGLARNPSSERDPFNFITDSFAMSSGGWLGGGQLGVNWQTGALVFGLEADLQKTSQSETACVLVCFDTAHLNLDEKLSWFGTARARLGFAQGPALFYGTGGLAFGKTELTAEKLFITTVGPDTVSSTKTGWTLGAGVESALAGNWSVKAEYLYVDLGNISLTQPDIAGTRTVSSDIHNNVFRLGLNYHL